jgi:hypothetical protein
MGAVAPVRGQWSVAGGQLRQGDVEDVGPYARITGVSAVDYRVEATLTVSAHKQTSGWASGLYLLTALRIGAEPGQPGYYACGVSPSYGLVVAECELGQPQTACWQRAHFDVTVVPATPYRVQARIAGSTLTCALPDLGKAITQTAPFDGAPGLATTYASGSYDDLRVCVF